jgi:hypothetical protein
MKAPHGKPTGRPRRPTSRRSPGRWRTTPPTPKRPARGRCGAAPSRRRGAGARAARGLAEPRRGPLGLQRASARGRHRRSRGRAAGADRRRADRAADRPEGTRPVGRGRPRPPLRELLRPAGRAGRGGREKGRKTSQELPRTIIAGPSPAQVRQAQRGRDAGDEVVEVVAPVVPARPPKEAWRCGPPPDERINRVPGRAAPNSRPRGLTPMGARARCERGMATRRCCRLLGVEVAGWRSSGGWPGWRGSGGASARAARRRASCTSRTTAAGTSGRFTTCPGAGPPRWSSTTPTRAARPWRSGTAGRRNRTFNEVAPLTPSARRSRLRSPPNRRSQAAWPGCAGGRRSSRSGWLYSMPDNLKRVR